MTHAMEEHPDLVGQRDPNDYMSIRDAAFLFNKQPRDLHGLCEKEHVEFRVAEDGAWHIHIPSLVEYLARTMGFPHRGQGVSSVFYSDIQTALVRLEKKIDTILERELRMTEADSRIEADVTSLQASFTAVSQLISSLQATVATLTDEVAAGGAPSAQTLSDLDNVSSQIAALNPPAPPADGGDTPPADGGDVPPADGGDVPPADGGDVPPVDDGSGAGDPPVDPTSGGATVSDPADTVGQAAPQSAQPQSP